MLKFTLSAAALSALLIGGSAFAADTALTSPAPQAIAASAAGKSSPAVEKVGSDTIKVTAHKAKATHHAVKAAKAIPVKATSPAVPANSAAQVKSN